MFLSPVVPAGPRETVRAGPRKARGISEHLLRAKPDPVFDVTLAPWTRGHLAAKWGERVPASRGFMKTNETTKARQAVQGAGRWEEALHGALQPVLPRPPHLLPGVPS